MDLILYAGMLGLTGQFIRLLVGVQKALRQGGRPQPYQLILVNLLLGFTAGSVSVLVVDFGSYLKSKEILLLLAAGYCGVDVIEGLLGRRKVSPK